MTSPTILSVRQLVKTYGGRNVVNKLTFHVGEGEIVGLLGPNGAGKTTAFYMVMGLIRPNDGRIIFNNTDVTQFSVYRRARMGMGYLAQEPSIFRSLTVKENILCILETLPLTRQQRKHRLEELLHELHLESLSNKIASSLSGGERRRLEITRAMVTNPSFFLLDEPFANIDPIAINDVKHMIKLLAKKNISVLITDHNAREIFSVVDRSYIINAGEVMLSGSVDDLVNNPEARQTYLGEDFKL